MAFERRWFSAVLLHILLCYLWSFLSAEDESDICCLKSIKDSLEDPYDSFHTWDFKNQSKIYICNRFDVVICYDHDKLFSIQLSSKGLKCQFPRGITNCSSLETLDLSKKWLSGHFPSHIFSMLPSLYRLDLSNNMFSCEIPLSIGNLTSLSTLDLSYNKFCDEIPASIGNLTSLNILTLNNNEFTGEIPCELGKLNRLTKFSVANNLPWRPVPVFSTDVDVGKMENYLNNSGLCGGPLKPCDQFHQSFREGLISGYVFSATSVIVVYVWPFVLWTQLKKAREKKPFRAVGPYYSYIRRKREKEQQREENQMDKLHLDLPQKTYQSLLHLHLGREMMSKSLSSLSHTDYFKVLLKSLPS